MSLGADSSLAHIHGLPAEIVIIIFEMSMPLYSFHTPTRIPTILSHVCSRWRKLAISHKLLWAEIPCKLGAGAAQAAIERSHPIPISIDTVDFDSEDEPELDKASYAALEPALRELYRVRDLCIALPGDTYKDDLSVPRTTYIRALCTAPGLLLERLSIYAVHGSLNIPATLFHSIPAPHMHSWSTYNCNIPHDLFNGLVPPRLEDLTIEHGFIPMSSCLLRAQLTSLVLNYCTFGDTILDLLNVLSCCPDLQILHLSNIGHQIWGSIPSPLPVVSFSNVEDFRVETYFPDEAARLIQHISVPDDAEYNLGFNCERRAVLDVMEDFPSDIYEHLVQHFAGMVEVDGHFSRVKIMYRISLDHGPDDGFTIRANEAQIMSEDKKSSTSVDADEQESSGGIEPDSETSADQRQTSMEASSGDSSEGEYILPSHFWLSCGLYRGDANALMRPFLRKAITLPVFSEGITALEICYPVVFRHADLWSDLAAAFPNVTEILAVQHTAHGFLLALKADRAPLFPKLSKLHFEAVDFSMAISSRDKTSVWTLVEQIPSIRSLDIFQLEECTITSKQVKTLDRIVSTGRVEWDSITKIKHSYSHLDFDKKNG